MKATDDDDPSVIHVQAGFVSVTAVVTPPPLYPFVTKPGGGAVVVTFGHRFVHERPSFGFDGHSVVTEYFSGKKTNRRDSKDDNDETTNSTM